MNPTIFGVRASMLARFYGWRLRRHTAQELLAGSGIAVGVALIFGVLVANTSLLGSAGQILGDLNGSARLQLAARSDAGFPQQLARKVSALPGVQDSASFLRGNAAIVGPRGRQTVQLIGVSSTVVGLGGVAGNDPTAVALLLGGGIAVPSQVAHVIGARENATVELLARGDARATPIRVVLGSSSVGPVADSTIAVSRLSVAERLLDEPGRITQILVRPARGDEQLVKAGLRRLAGGRLDVESANNESLLLSRTARPTNESTTLFAVISGMVGFLLALNAMLLTMPERRRFIADLRIQGFDGRQVALILGFQALVLGIVASVAGIALGDGLSRTLFHEVPVYLAVAFPVSAHQVVKASSIGLALGGGLLATLLASIAPLLDLRRGRAADAVFREGVGATETGRATRRTLGALGVALIAGVSTTVLLVPKLTVVGGVLLAVALVCLIPALFTALLGLFAWIAERIPGSMLVVAVAELRAISTRSIALACVAALAVYGSVAIGGAQSDLIAGLNTNFAQYLGTADLWVTTGSNDLTTNSFRVKDTAALIAREPAVSSVRAYQGGFLDLGGTRMWIIARPPADVTLIPPSQMRHGNLARADSRIRAGGWAAVSQSFADARGLRLGEAFTLDVPAGSARLRVAAITTNLGWPAGAIVINTADYQRYWQSLDPTALEVNLRAGVSPDTGKHEVERVLAGRPGLAVQTFAERNSQYRSNARQGLQSLGEIADLLLVAAALAVASALGAAIWQRRGRLAALKIQGFDRLQLWRALLLESSIVLGIGSLMGAALGIFGHALASRWLELTTGFPAPFHVDWPQIAGTLAIVAGIATAVVALPGYRAARVPTGVGLEE